MLYLLTRDTKQMVVNFSMVMIMQIISYSRLDRDMKFIMMQFLKFES